MDKKELEFEKTLDYLSLCKYLQKKYGLPECPYFLTKNSANPTTKNKRTNEGLFLHHIFENELPDLGKRPIMAITPFEWQMPENLLYCNYLEHYLLHLKITKEGKSIKGLKILGIGGIINHFCEALNYYFEHYTFFHENTFWSAYFDRGHNGAIKYKKMIEAKDKQAEPIKENIDEYLLLLKETDEAICDDEFISDYCKDKWKMLFRDNFSGKYTTKIYKMFVERYGTPKVEVKFKK